MAKSKAKSSAAKTVNPSANPILMANVGWDSKSALFTGGTPISHVLKAIQESGLDADKHLHLDRVLNKDQDKNVRSQSIVQIANTRGKLELEIVSTRSINATKAKAQNLNTDELQIHDYVVFKRYLQASNAKKLSNTRTPFFYLNLTEGTPALTDVSFKIKESPFYKEFQSRVFAILKESALHLTGNDLTVMTIYPLIFGGQDRFIKNGQQNYNLILNGDQDEVKARIEIFRQYCELAINMGFKSCTIRKSMVQDSWDAKQELRSFIGSIESEVNALVAKKNRVENFESEVLSHIESIDNLKELMAMQKEIKESRLDAIKQKLEAFRQDQAVKRATSPIKKSRTSKRAQQKAELEATKAKNAELEAQLLKMKEEFRAMMEQMKNNK